MCLKCDVSKVHSVSSQTYECFRQFVSSQSIWLNLRQFVSPQEFGGLRQFVSSLFRLMWLLSRAFANHHPWYPESLYLIFTIPGIQGLYTSSCLVPRTSISFFLIPGIQLEVVMPNWGRQWLWFAFVYWDPSFGTHHPSGGKQWVRLAFLWYDPSCWPHRPKFKT